MDNKMSKQSQNYIGSQQHWEDRINDDYYYQKQMEKDIEKQIKKQIEKQIEKQMYNNLQKPNEIEFTSDELETKTK